MMARARGARPRGATAPARRIVLCLVMAAAVASAGACRSSRLTPSGDASGDTSGAPDGASGDAARWRCLTESSCATRVQTGPCTVPACEDGTCVARSRLDLVPCDDGDPCTSGTTCLQGACVGGKAVACDDDNPCTQDQCDAASGCVHAALDDGQTCDDADPCTEGDACQAGACVGTPDLDCACTLDTDCAPHDDANACNGRLRCTAGQCRIEPESVVQCQPPAAPCRLASCDVKSGQCVVTLAEDGATCDDKNPCTEDDVCDRGLCRGLPGPCVCGGDGDCEAFQQTGYDLCQGPLICLDGVCRADPDDAVLCEAGAPLTCVTRACDPGTGLCGLVAHADGTPCATGDPCEPTGACSFGGCKAPATGCDDANPCTEDTCDPVGGCQHVPLDGAACDDGDACSEADTCVEGICQGAARSCDDGNPCTIDACTPGSGTCQHVSAPDGLECEDGTFCAIGGACAGGFCLGLEAVVCEQSAPDACVEMTCQDGAGCVPTTSATCLTASVLWSTTFPCSGSGAWQVSAQGADIGWAIDASPEVPGAWDTGCSLNLNDGATYGGGKEPTVATALSPAFAGPGDDAVEALRVSFMEWTDFDAAADRDLRRVLLMASDGSLIGEVELGKEGVPSTAWELREVTLGTQGAAGPYRVGFAFDSVVAAEAGGAGWFVDKLVVTSPAP